MRWALLWGALAGCPAPADTAPPRPLVQPPATSDAADAVALAAEAAGWTAQEGRLVFSDMAYCCEAGVTCLGNNPSTPYALVALPPAPGQTVPEVDTFWFWGPIGADGLSRDYRMRADEAVVLVGTSPPPSKYFSVRSSIATRQDPLTGARRLVAGSLGPTTNHLTMAADNPGEAVWSAPMAIVSVADHGIEATVRSWLIAAGVSAGDVHVDPISSGDVRWGLDHEADTMMLIGRVAVPDDPTALAAYRADPPVRVLRLTPPEGTGTAPMGRPALVQPGGGTDESAWRGALDLLDAAIRERFAGMEAETPSINAGSTELFTCIERYGCIGEVADRMTAAIPATTLGTPDEHVVVFGVNHERTGHSSYSNFAVMVHDNWVGADAVDSREWVGSARPWIGDHPQVDDLYAWILARDCSLFAEPCLQLETSCPWPDLDETWFVTWRHYLDPRSGAAPLVSELELDRLIRFTPGN